MTDCQQWVRNYRSQCLRKRLRRQFVRQVLEFIGLVALSTILIFSIFGCASVPLATKKPLVFAQAKTWSGVVQVSLMGDVCTDNEDCLEVILKTVFDGLPMPTVRRVKFHSGSSLTDAQGIATIAGTAHLGARYTARAKLKLHWTNILPAQYKKAVSLLRMMRPTSTPALANR